MAIKIDPEKVKTSLTNYANAYPRFHKALKLANDTFSSLNSYWTGERYQKIMTAWNKVVPELNKQLKVLAKSSENLNTLFKNYTTADTKAISVEAAHVITLNTCNISKKSEINYDNTKLLGDLKTISTAISDARNIGILMKDICNRAPWSGEGSINDLKSDIITVLGKIDTSLSGLEKDVNKAFTDTSTAFEGAKNSYK